MKCKVGVRYALDVMVNGDHPDSMFCNKPAVACIEIANYHIGPASLGNVKLDVCAYHLKSFKTEKVIARYGRVF